MTALSRCFRSNQIGQALHLREIEPAVLERPARELARARPADSPQLQPMRRARPQRLRGRRVSEAPPYLPRSRCGDPGTKAPAPRRSPHRRAARARGRASPAAAAARARSTSQARPTPSGRTRESLRPQPAAVRRTAQKWSGDRFAYAPCRTNAGCGQVGRNRVSVVSMTSPSATSSTHENRLARETSPYLLQHQNNPVDWWAWGPEALAEAKRSNKPILLSVGYAACHWCHVMAHESFEDDATARVMNELFVNIKVDREERPDIDQIYMAALHHLGEQGGWPLTMFLTPDGEPIWGGTYFPNSSRYGKARLRRRAAPDRAAVPRRAAEDRGQSRRTDGAASRRRAEARHRHPWRGRA